MMPTRRRTRAQQRSQRITAERNRNRNDRLTRQRAYTYARAAPDDEHRRFNHSSAGPGLRKFADVSVRPAYCGQ
ncbi:MAG: hypothetical protein QOE52_2021 [Mycobacterium sp.]|nr:hypothetical protein [Mycobacterium sp.]